MVTITLVSTVLMSLLLIGAVVAMIRFVRNDRDPRGRGQAGADGPWGAIAGRLDAIGRHPLTWTASFLVLALGLGAGSMVIAGDLAGDAIGGIPTIVYGILGGILLLYLCWGTYASMRYRGFGNAASVAGGLWMFGLVFILIVALQLILA